MFKTAISAYHVQIDGTSVGKHPKVGALLAGIFNQRPAQPRYAFIWDVEMFYSILGLTGMTIHHLMVKT